MASTITRKEREELEDDIFTPEAFAVLEKQLTLWQRIGIAGLVAFVLAVVVIVVLALRYGPFPYPIVYDPDGRIIWHGTAPTTREERFIDVRLVEWVKLCRAMSSDETRLLEDREACKAMLTGEAAKKYAVYSQETIATYLDKQRRVLVQIDLKTATIARQGNDRVQITWDETWTPEVGYGSEAHRFQVTLTHAWYARPSNWSLDRARLNPSRVYVTDFWWSEVRTEAR